MPRLSQADYAKPEPHPQEDVNSRICATCGFHEAENESELSISLDLQNAVTCTQCNKWYHMTCVQFEHFQCHVLIKYFCPECLPLYGPHKFMEIRSPHRISWYDRKEADMPMEIGTRTWCENFKQSIRTDFEFAAPSDTFQLLSDGTEFLKHVGQHGGLSRWNYFVKILNPNGLSAKFPTNDELNLRRVLELIGPTTDIIVQDVFSQLPVEMKMKTLYQKMEDTEARDHRYNLVSLDVRKFANLSILFQVPKFIENISLVNLAWANELKDDSENSSVLRQACKKPAIESRLFIHMADTFLNFKMEMSGSSFYLHLIKGKMSVIIAPPKADIIVKFIEYKMRDRPSQWLSNACEEDFKKVEVRSGETLLIPGGYIFAIWNDTDCYGVQGSFLHFANMEQQFNLFEMELSILKQYNSAITVSFPNFENIHFLYAEYYVIPTLENANKSKTDVTHNHFNMWNTCEVLHSKLKIWNEQEENGDEERMKDHKKRILKILKEETVKQKKVQKRPNV